MNHSNQTPAEVSRIVRFHTQLLFYPYLQFQTPVVDKRKNRDLPQINERIKYPEVRVIDGDGTQLGIMSPRDGLKLAQEQEQDLVLVSDKADPPVCRIQDYGKYKFEQEKKAREAKKKQHTADVKEVKMRYKIEEHDYNVRLNNARKFLKKGDKVKATISFRGREIQHSNLAEELLKRLAKDLEEEAEVQQEPKREGRNMMMLLSPKKEL
nr:translation initiation factor IF-3 [Roseofilum halophilum]